MGSKKEERCHSTHNTQHMMLLLHPPSPARSCVLGATAAAWAVCLVQRWDDVYDCATARLQAKAAAAAASFFDVFLSLGACVLCCRCCCGLLWIHAAQLCWKHNSHRRLSQPDHGRDHDLLSCTQDMHRFSFESWEWPEIGWATKRCSPSTCPIRFNVFGIIFDLFLFRRARRARCIASSKGFRNSQFSMHGKCR